MEIETKKLPGSQIEIEIKIPTEEFDDYIKKATLNLGRGIEKKGFRKGKIPKEIIESEVGEGGILAEAAELAVKESYVRAIRQLADKIEIIGQPEVKILKLARGNPFEFRAKTSVMPQIELPDYKKIASLVKKAQISVKEEEIDDALRWFQKSRAKFTLKTDSCQKGNFVEVIYSSSQIENGKEFKDAFVLGEGKFIPGFEENLIGMKQGEEKEFPLTLPEQFPSFKFWGEHLAGKEVRFRVKINSVQSMELPEINDQFVKNLGNFGDVESFKKSIKEGINLEKENQESQRLRAEILEKITQKTSCEPPAVLIESEKSRLLEDLKQRVSQILKISFPEYLQKIKKTEKEVAENLLPESRKRIKNILVLREIGKREGIDIAEKEVEDEVSKIIRNYSGPEEARKNLDPEELKDYTREVIRNEKILARIESFAQK